MSPEAQRITIAEACPGVILQLDGGRWGYMRNGILVDGSPLQDLNASHEMEKVLTFEQCDDYRDNLKEICLRDSLESDAGSVHALFATAAQRAEAFLRTLNLWRDIRRGSLRL